MPRRFLALLALAAALVAAGLGSAATINGSNAGELLRGTPGADTMFGRRGNDRLLGRGGNDLLHGGPGADRLLGGAGDDRIAAQGDDGRDRVACGPGRDLANVEAPDTVAADCETVARRISKAVGDIGGQAQAEVEPDSFSWGQTVVAAFQVGRHISGGAVAIGWARSRGGRTWRAGLLPGLRQGPDDRNWVTDPSVAYDVVHRMWLISTLRGSPASDELVISRSRDGLAWRRPVVAAQGDGDTFDKEWVACDNGRVSAFRGHCYLSYWNVPAGVIETRTSTDGGATWSRPVPVPPNPRTNGQVNGPQPVIRPNGTVVVLFVSYFQGFVDEISASRSTDGGVTFGAPVRAARAVQSDVLGIRAPQLPSADVDADGRIYLVWHECPNGPDCEGTDLLLATSPDGVSWSAPRTVPVRVGVLPGSHVFLPAIAVRPGTAAARAHLAITYYTVPPPCGLPVCPGVEAAIVESLTGGSSWRLPQKLSAQPMSDFWIADGGIGRMLADYISTSWVNGRPVAVFALASEPHGAQFRQSIFAARPPTPALRRN